MRNKKFRLHVHPRAGFLLSALKTVNFKAIHVYASLYKIMTKKKILALGIQHLLQKNSTWGCFNMFGGIKTNVLSSHLNNPKFNRFFVQFPTPNLDNIKSGNLYNIYIKPIKNKVAFNKSRYKISEAKSFLVQNNKFRNNDRNLFLKRRDPYNIERLFRKIVYLFKSRTNKSVTKVLYKDHTKRLNKFAINRKITRKNLRGIPTNLFMHKFSVKKIRRRIRRKKTHSNKVDQKDRPYFIVRMRKKPKQRKWIRGFRLISTKILHSRKKRKKRVFSKIK
jgi:hypothetical protein